MAVAFLLGRHPIDWSSIVGQARVAHRHSPYDRYESIDGPTTIRVPFPDALVRPVIAASLGVSGSAYHTWGTCAVPLAKLPGSGGLSGTLCVALVRPDPTTKWQLIALHADAVSATPIARGELGWYGSPGEEPFVDLIPTRFHAGYLILVGGAMGPSDSSHSHALYRCSDTVLEEVWSGSTFLHLFSNQSLYHSESTISYATLRQGTHNEIYLSGVAYGDGISGQKKHWALYRWDAKTKKYTLRSGHQPDL